MTDKPKLLSVQDVAEYLNVSDETVRRKIAEGKFPAYQVGRQLRLSLDEVLEALRAEPKRRRLGVRHGR